MGETELTTGGRVKAPRVSLEQTARLVSYLLSRVSAPSLIYADLDRLWIWSRLIHLAWPNLDDWWHSGWRLILILPAGPERADFARSCRADFARHWLTPVRGGSFISAISASETNTNVLYLLTGLTGSKTNPAGVDESLLVGWLADARQADQWTEMLLTCRLWIEALPR